MDMNKRMRDGMERIDKALAGHGLKEDNPVYEAVRNEYQYMCYLLAETIAVAKTFEEIIEKEDHELFSYAANPRKNLANVMRRIRTILPAEWMDYGDEDDDPPEIGEDDRP